jgi:hypothetical protein
MTKIFEREEGGVKTIITPRNLARKEEAFSALEKRVLEDKITKLQFEVQVLTRENQDY